MVPGRPLPVDMSGGLRESRPVSQEFPRNRIHRGNRTHV
jgi:hypothetical protein